MQRLQVTVLLIIVGIFIFIFWMTQKDSLLKNQSLSLTPSTSPLPGEITPISSPTPNPQAQQQAQQQQQAAETVQGPVKEDLRASISAQIKTSKGLITVSLYNDVAKGAVKNFVTKANAGFYRGLTFHRVEDWVIQGGDPKGNGTGGGVVQTELTGKSFTAGALGYAASSNMQVGQGARISNDSQFFIVKTDSPWLDPTYTNFGMVTAGMDVVSKIQIGDKILEITIQ